MSEPGTSTLGSDRLQVARETPLDPDFARVRALVEMRMLGDEVAPVKIGRFTLLERVAEGGMGVVFSAFDAELDRKIAVKLLRGDRDDDPVVRQRIVREAQAMAKLSHPNVAHVYEVGEHDGRTFIAMEFVRGQTLRAWVRERMRSWREVVEVYVQAGRGLAAAHAAGLVHRDFKPDNALIGVDARVRVLDFGLARVDAGEPSEAGDASAPSRVDVLTRTGSIMGTPAYMAPEQFLGETVDAKSDQFAFCVALWEALHGERPFAGTNRTVLTENVTSGTLSEPPKDSSVPSWLRAVIVRGLAPVRAERFATMDELLAALAADPSRRRRRMLAVGGGLLCVAIVAGGFAFDHARRGRACEREAERIAEVWNDEARARMGATILATDVSYAADTWARLEPRLDRYAAQWAEVRESTCRAATVDRTRSSDLAARTSECLDERRDALESFVALISADQPPVLGAVRGAASLPRIEPCTADGWLLQRPAVPIELRERVRTAALDRELTRNHARLEAPQDGEGLARARELATEAEAIGWPPLHARALMDLGSFFDRGGDFVAAKETLEQAAGIALRSGADEIATDAMGRLVVTITISGKEHDRALWWGWLAQAVLDRAGEVDPARQLEVHMRMGSLHQQRAAYAEAQDAYARAAELAETTFGSEHPLYLHALDGLAFAMVELGQIDESIALIEPAIAKLETILGASHPDVADLLTTLAIAQTKRGDAPAAATAYGRALVIQEAAFGPVHFRVANTLKNLGQVNQKLGKHEETAAAYERAIAIIEQLYGKDSPKLADPLLARGSSHYMRKEHAEALVDYRRALAIKEASLGPDHMHAGYIRINIAGAETDNGNPVEGVREYARALAIVEPTRGTDDLVTIMIRKDFARAQLEAGAPELAIELATAAIASCERVECPVHKRAEIHKTLAKSLWATNDRAGAIEHMRTAKTEIDRAVDKEILPEIEAWLAKHDR